MGRSGLHKWGGLQLVCWVEEARLRARVARRPGRIHTQQHGVEVAVQADFDNVHRVARRRTLLPEAPLARVEPGTIGLTRLPPRLLVHIGQHQHLARLRVLDDGGHKALGKIWAHCLTSRPIAARSLFTPDTESSPKWKTDAAKAASAPPAVSASY